MGYMMFFGEKRTTAGEDEKRERERERERERWGEKKKKHRACLERNLGFVLFSPSFCFTPLFANFPLLSSPFSLSPLSFFRYTYGKIILLFPSSVSFALSPK
jgi:hypothetical protein